MAYSLERQLPEEILEYIISLVPKETLASLCLVSKTLHRLATPHLYSHIAFLEDVDRADLAYLLLTSPSHAYHVRSLAVSEKLWTPGIATDDQQTWTDTEEKVLRQKCAEYAPCEPVAEEMHNRLKSHKDDQAILALLLASLPRLQKLDINLGTFIFGAFKMNDDFHFLLGIILRQVSSKVNPQADLIQDAYSTGSASYRSTAFTAPIHIATKCSNMVTLLQMPNLHSFYGSRFWDDDEFVSNKRNPFRKLKPRSCPATYIELRTAKLHPANLHLLLEATIPGKLKTFNYEIGGLCDIWYRVIMPCLAAHHNTLENLGLSHEYDASHGNDDGDARLYLPRPYSFTQFEALKRLKVAPVFVWDNEGLCNRAKYTEAATRIMLSKALPKGIEELWLTKANHKQFQEGDWSPYFIPDCLLPALEILLDHKAEDFPKLNRIVIQFTLIFWEIPWLDALALLCHRAVAMGIQEMILIAEPICSGMSSYVERDWGWNEDVKWEPGYRTDEHPKRRLVVTEEEDLRQTLRDWKNKDTEAWEKRRE
jgi:hypothetical protein